jgi:hypothetical protein
MLVGLAVALPPVDDTPVPVNATICGLFDEESVKVSVALRVPEAVGLKTTLAEQLLEAARLVPHVFAEMLNSPALLPVIATLLIVIDEAEPFFSVAVWAPLVDPMFVLANVKLAGLADTPPGA